MNKKKIGLLFLIFLFFIVVFFSPIFKISSIQITGNKILSKDEVADTFKDFIGKNILFISDKDLDNLLESNKYIASYKLDKDYPSSLIIEIEEEKYLAYYVIGDKTYFVNSGLDILKNDDRLLNGKIPEIIGLSNKAEEIDSLRDDKKLSDLISSLKDKDIINKVKIIDISNSYDIRLATNDDIIIYLGSSENLSKKINNLAKIIKKIDMSTTQSIDFRGKDPTIKIKK